MKKINKVLVGYIAVAIIVLVGFNLFIGITDEYTMTDQEIVDKYVMDVYGEDAEAEHLYSEYGHIYYKLTGPDQVEHICSLNKEWVLSDYFD